MNGLDENLGLKRIIVQRKVRKMGNKNRRKANPITSHRTKITLDTGDTLSQNEKDLLDLQIRWVCESQLIPVIALVIEDEKK